MNRPKFDDIKSYEEFIKYYWYRDELQAICKSLHLEYNGEKKDLNKIIESYFNGILIPHKSKPTSKARINDLTLDTSLLDCGFTFGPRFREFFIQITGDQKFKFTADMVATVKVVKETKDKEFTLRNLLDIKYGNKSYAKFDNSSCQWNQFLKDFCADKDNDIYREKLKTASRFWKLLRNSDLPKVYSKEFIEKNRDKI
ncbi:MAG: SAP domain-containing protein [Anaeroplasmataceae bacterium]|nr:SAP domain-containing protein [Anaeroplasmataceae bacterium]MDE6414264.1 SAP domain-containing protein [Anaeroplasmataceae bacterium]